MNHEQIENLLDVAGWKVLWENVDQLRWEENLADSLRPHEYWYMCERKR
jgi:hypothetical protein